MQTPAPFEYERATSVEGAIASLQRLGPGARVIAGGHSLLPMMKLRLAKPEHLIDINDLKELSYIREQGDEVSIGALTRHVELLKSDLLAERFPLFRDAENVIADPVVRNRGTIGGSLCQADAAEDLSAVCSAVKAKAVIRGADGERVVEMEDFHLGPLHDRGGRRRDAHGGPNSGATGRRQRAREGRAPRRRLGDRRCVGGRLDRRRHDRRRGDRAQRGRAHDDPSLASRGASARQGSVGGAVRQAGEIASEDCSPTADGRGPVDYKRHLAGVLTIRALRRATARALHRGGLIMNVSITINGEQVSREIEPRLLLVHFIRDTPGLTGTHWGCDTSNCGACVVQMDGEPVKSCTTLAAMCEGHEIRTVESLEVDGQLDPIQMGFHETHALQCGFCTPGMLMTARALLDENPDPTEQEIRTAISGAICRCTGYKNIVGAVRWAAEHQATAKQEV